MTKAPNLTLPDFTKQFIIQPDASRNGMGTVLTQNGHPISFFRKKFFPKLINSSTYVRELHAITAAIQNDDTIFCEINSFSIPTKKV